jgi:prepilin-type N-terminal cleavage/methylation domain-containing protein
MHVSKRGFTILEVLLVVAALGILAGLVVVAINPGSQLATTRNAQREVDVHILLNAVHQYATDNAGEFPSGIPLESDCETASGSEICRPGAASCSGYVSLAVLTLNERYLVDIPVEPSFATTSNGVGYRIIRSSTGRVSVCAPLAEEGELIEVKR